MACRYIGLYVALCIITCTALHTVEAAAVAISVSPNPVLEGVNSSHSVRCDYSLTSGELFQFIRLLAADYQIIAEVTEMSNGSQWTESTAANSLRQRGDLRAYMELQYLTMILRNTQFADCNRTYLCSLQYTTNNGSGVHVQVSTAVVTVQVAPLAPIMKVTPASDSVIEFTTMTFKCKGNVGSPAGTFQWYIFPGSGQGVNVTEQAVMSPKRASGDGCTFLLESQLTWSVMRTDQNKPFVVRCRVNHPKSSNACSNARMDFCAMSPEISIHYPVSVRVISGNVTADEGADVTINCFYDGNPRPYRIDWQKEGENEMLPSSDGALTLINVKADDQGRYRCTGYNTIEGSTRYSWATVSVTVGKTSDVSKEDSSGTVNALGPILGSVLGVLLAIIAAIVSVICWRRHTQGESHQDTSSQLPDTQNQNRAEENSAKC